MTPAEGKRIKQRVARIELGTDPSGPFRQQSRRHCARRGGRRYRHATGVHPRSHQQDTARRDITPNSENRGRSTRAELRDRQAVTGTISP